MSADARAKRFRTGYGSELPCSESEIGAGYRSGMDYQKVSIHGGLSAPRVTARQTRDHEKGWVTGHVTPSDRVSATLSSTLQPFLPRAFGEVAGVGAGLTCDEGIRVSPEPVAIEMALG